MHFFFSLTAWERELFRDEITKFSGTFLLNDKYSLKITNLVRLSNHLGFGLSRSHKSSPSNIFSFHFSLATSQNTGLWLVHLHLLSSLAYSGIPSTHHSFYYWPLPFPLEPWSHHIGTTPHCESVYSQIPSFCLLLNSSQAKLLILLFFTYYRMQK